MKLFFQTTVAFLLAAAPVWAGLTWEQTQVSQDAKLGEKVVTLRYPFENKGATPVEIVKIKPACSCTTVELEKKVYQPGEKGELVALFEIGKRKGTQSRKVTVTTDDKVKETLIFTVAIPEAK